MIDEEHLHKIRFFDADVGHENLWADEKEEGLYLIKSIPYFVYNISVDDVIRAQWNKEDEILTFSEVVMHSEHTTIRVRLKSFTLDDDKAEVLLNKLEDFGAMVETLPPRLIAVDIPNPKHVDGIITFLTNDSIPWEWADKNAIGEGPI